MIRPGIEPANQPVPDGMAIHAVSFYAGVFQASHQAVTDDFQVGAWGLAAHVGFHATGPSVDHEPNTALLTPPRQLADFGVLEKAAWFGDGFQVLLHQRQVMLGKRGAPQNHMTT